MVMSTGFLWQGDENILKLMVVMITQLYESTTKHGIIHFKRLNCIICALYCDKAVTYKKKKRQRLEGLSIPLATCEQSNLPKIDLFIRLVDYVDALSSPKEPCRDLFYSPRQIS